MLIFSNEAQLREICFNYKNGDKLVRENLIKKYGEKRIKSAIEETSSMELIENTSKQCPQCKSITFIATKLLRTNKKSINQYKGDY